MVDGDTLTVIPIEIDNTLSADEADVVNFIPIESDRYDRSVALVISNRAILNMEQVRRGHAVVSEKY